MNINSVKEYDKKNWYVLQVKPNREVFIKDAIQKFFPQKFKTIVFTKELLHKKNKKYIKLRIPLFPGYLFVHKKINEIVGFLNKQLNNEFIKPVCFNNIPGKVSEKEMQLLITHSDQDGNLKLSKGIKTGDQIKIIDGPLKNINSKILFINEKKRKAKVEFSLFKRTMSISLGIDIFNQNTTFANNLE